MDKTAPLHLRHWKQLSQMKTKKRTAVDAGPAVDDDGPGDAVAADCDDVQWSGCRRSAVGVPSRRLADRR